MTPKQIKHITDLFSLMFTEKWNELDAAHTFVVPTLTISQKIEEVKSGRFESGVYDTLDYIMFDVQQDGNKDERDKMLNSKREELTNLHSEILEEFTKGDKELALSKFKLLEDFKVVS